MNEKWKQTSDQMVWESKDMNDVSSPLGGTGSLLISPVINSSKKEWRKDYM